MGHEIKIGGVSLVVDDPHGQLVRTAETEQRIEHQDAEALEASVRTMRNRPSVPVINTVDPFASVHARAHLFDKVVNGRQGLASLALAWMLFGIPFATIALGIGFTLHDNWLRPQGNPVWIPTLVGSVAELSIVLALGLLIRRTIRVIRERKRAATASPT